MTEKTMSFSAYLDNKLKFFKFVAPAICAAFAGVVSFICIVFFYSEANSDYLKTFAPHVSTLVETQDRPELQRFLNSISEKKDVAIEVIDNGRVLASSQISNIGTVPLQAKKIIALKNATLATTGLAGC